MNIIQRPLNHFDERGPGVKPSILLIHYTDTKTAQDAEDYFFARIKHPSGGRVSCHYMIDRDGTVIQYVDESKRAWHAGRSYWDGMTDINAHSIGIELVNPGHTHGYTEFPEAQMKALRALCKDIIARHGIKPHNILAHSDVAPERKTDPGELFAWHDMAREGLGVWPAPLTAEDYKKGEDYAASHQSLREAFTKVGYNPQADLDAVIRAFQRHFYPEAFKNPDAIGKSTRDMGARLHWLVRHKPQ